jgi:hypothetical protein
VSFTVVDPHDVAGFSLVIEMKLDTTNFELLQHFLDSLLDGRVIRAVATDELLDNGPERRWRQFRVWDTHRIILPHET